MIHAKNCRNKLVRNLKLVNSFFNLNQVSYLILYVTNRCNFRCDFCFYHAEIEKGRKADELTLDEIRRISEKIGPLIQLSLTGGEPFIREDLVEICGFFIRNSYVKYITIPTNATLTDKIVAYLEDILPKYPDTYFRIAFSIDGIEEQHDLVRSTPGAYEKVKKSYKAISSLRKRYENLILDSNSIYSSATEDNILKTLKTIKEQFSFNNLSVTYARGNLKDASLKKVSFQKYIEMNDYLQTFKRIKEKRFLYYVWRGVRDLSREYLIRTEIDGEFVTPCVAGKKLLVIYETGEVSPCEILEQGMGNIRDFDYDIKRLLSQERNKKLVNWIKESRCKCSFECALAANVLWGKFAYLKILKASIKNVGSN